MSHQVETMAYTNEVPWHGLGTYVEHAPDVDEMIRLAQLGWTVERVPMTTADGEDVPGFYALVRSSDRRVLDVVGSRYMPIQNREAFEFFTDFVEAGDATMETAGSLRGGRYVWGLANLGSGFNVGRTKDRVNGYLLVGVPHEQGKSLIIRTTHVRVVCNNTLTMALRESLPEFRMAHRTAFDASMITRAREVLGLAREQVAEFKETANTLKSIKLAVDDVLRIVVPIMSPKTTDDGLAAMIAEGPDAYTPRIAAVMGAYTDAPGADPGNAWGALNAITYYADHMAGNTDDTRLANAWFGKTARQKTAVMTSLLELAAA
jgi:phage/plasmid-like protein (TIGR03299 family)